MTKLLKFISNDNDLDFVDEQVFTAGNIGSMGWYYVDTVYDSDPFGEIKVYPVDNTTVLVDPDACDVMQRDWRRVIRSNWMTWEEIRDTWRDKVPAIKKESPWWIQTLANLIERFPANLRGKVSDDLKDEHNNLFRVIEHWERRKKRFYEFSDGGESTFDVDNDRLAKGMLERGYQLVSQGMRKYMHLNIIFPVAEIILESRDLDYENYPFIGFFPLKFSGLPLVDAISYVENLHGVQEEKNRMRSVIQDILQKQASGAVILPEGEEALRLELEDTGSKPAGYYTRKTNNQQRIETLRPDFPSGYAHVEENCNIDIQRISAQPLAQHGISESSDESGVLFNSKLQQGMTAMAPIFSAFARARRLLGRVIIERIQKDFTMPNVYRILGKNNDPSEMIEINQPTPYGTVLNDVRVGKYSVVIEEEEETKTIGEGELKSYVELMKAMPEVALQMIVPILMPGFIEASSIHNAKELAQQIRERMQPQGQQGQQPGGQQGQILSGQPGLMQ